MNRIVQALASNPIFHELAPEALAEIAERLQVRIAWKDEVIALEGDECKSMGLILSGQLILNRYSRSGDTVTVAFLGAGDVIGEDVFLSTHPHYRLMVEAATNSKIAWIPKQIFLQATAQHPSLMTNMVRFLSDRSVEANRRIILLSQRTLQQKITTYLLMLLEQDMKAEAAVSGISTPRPSLSKPCVELPASKVVVAGLLGIPRPSLSRTLVNMEKDGLVQVSGRVIWLTDLNRLEAAQEDDEDDDGT